MDGFLKQVAADLYGRYGDDISSLSVLLPNRRAGLFFGEALSSVIERPLWQPAQITVDALMEEVSGLATGDRIRLITELYKVYAEFHPTESFDSFYFWGELLLGDFDSIDKYLIDADTLFANLVDMHELDDRFDYLSAEQKAAIAKFWNSFGREPDFSPQQRDFLSVWRTLAPVYRSFRDRLRKLGIAYQGMVYRETAERILSDRAAQIPERHYVIAGFNALSRCEQVLFEWLQKNFRVDFYWDYDNYYLLDGNQEAGMFMRDNLRRFPPAAELRGGYDNFVKPKRIRSVSTASGVLQCKYAGNVLKKLAEEKDTPPDRETAVVLTDESLLVPLLWSLPDEVADINITMGYPLRMHPAYTFVERLVELQNRRRCRPPQDTNPGSTAFYHSDVEGLLRNPYLADMSDVNASSTGMSDADMSGVSASSTGMSGAGMSGVSASSTGMSGADMNGVSGVSASSTGMSGAGMSDAETKNTGAANSNSNSDPDSNSNSDPSPNPDSHDSDDVFKAQYIYIAADRLHTSPIRKKIFTAPEGWRALSDYLIDVIAEVARHADGPFFALITDHIRTLANSLDGCGIELSTKIYTSLLRRSLQSVTVPFEGEPLAGVQVMGILETRALDFENIVFLSMNDSNSPGNLTGAPSFIPYNLKAAYGLPTPEHHEGVYAYHFFRLMQRAKNVDMVWSSTADDRNTGEPSRYICQLDYESPHEVEKNTVTVDVNLSPAEAITVAKTPDVMSKLAGFLLPETETADAPAIPRKLSPSLFFTYIECPLKFYFRAVAGLRADEELAEDVDNAMFGSILHLAMEKLYAPLVGIPNPQTMIRALIDSPEVEDAVTQAVAELYIKEENARPEDWGGGMILVHKTITDYIDRNILPFDASRPEGYTIEKLEEWVSAGVEFPCRNYNADDRRHGSCVLTEENCSGENENGNCDDKSSNKGGIRNSDGSADYNRNGSRLPLRTVLFHGKVDRLDRLADGTLRVVDYKTGSPRTKSRDNERFLSIDTLFAGRADERISAVLQTLLYAMMLRANGSGNTNGTDSTGRPTADGSAAGGATDGADSAGRTVIGDGANGSDIANDTGNAGITEECDTVNTSGSGTTATGGATTGSNTCCQNACTRRNSNGEPKVQPALYYIKNLSKEGYSPLILDAGDKREVEQYADYSDEFETRLRTTLAELFDPAVPFTQCVEPYACAWCDFNAICRR